MKSVERRRFQAGRIDRIERADIDSDHRISHLILAEGVRFDPACPAEEMGNRFLIEQIFAETVFARERTKILMGNENEQEALDRAVRAVAGDDPIEIGRNRITDFPAMTSAFVTLFHILLNHYFFIYPAVSSGQVIARFDVLHPFDRQTDRFLIEFFRVFDLLLERGGESGQDIAKRYPIDLQYPFPLVERFK